MNYGNICPVVGCHYHDVIDHYTSAQQRRHLSKDHDHDDLHYSVLQLNLINPEEKLGKTQLIAILLGHGANCGI